jgi:glutathionyl-hydroquinone reductase
MAQLSNKIKLYLDREVDFTKDVRLQDDRIDGVPNPYIKEWNVEEVQPTEEQLNAFESEADAVEALNQVYANRKAEYPSVQDLVVALYDTDDKTAIDEKRAEIKLKYPKPGA